MKMLNINALQIFFRLIAQPLAVNNGFTSDNRVIGLNAVN